MRRITNITTALSTSKRAWFYFALGLLYVAICLVGRPSIFVSDEDRYVMFAGNLAQGYFSPPGEIRLANGPGYPLVLLPFELVGGAWLGARLLNVAFLLGAVWLTERTLRRFVAPNVARIGALTYGLFPIAVAFLPLLMTEPLAQLLVAALAHFICEAMQNDSPPVAWIAGGIIGGALAMVKVLFGPVITVSLLVAAAFWIVHRSAPILRVTRLLALALLCCAPYLFYTWKLTGQPFYWSTVGGSNQYWMASPFEGETGDWHGIDLQQLEIASAELNPQLLENRVEFFRSLESLDQVQRDRRFKEQAWIWMRDHPTKWLSNWLHNQGRLWLGQPYSYSRQRLTKLAVAVPGTLLAAALALSVLLALRSPRRVPPAALALLLLSAIGLGGTSILTAANRLLVPFLPLLFVWVAAVLGRNIGLIDEPSQG